MKLPILLSRATVLATGMLGLAFTPHEAGAADLPRPEISFVVHQLMEENVEGPDVERSYFMAGGRRIVFGKPKDCQLTTDDGGLLILLTDASLDGEIHVSRSPFTPESDLASDALIYREAASRNVPTSATKIQVLQPEMNPYPFNGWKSLGFTWTYSFGGRAMIRTVSYINLEMGVQIVVTTLAEKSDAEKVGKIAKKFMSSWWVVGAR